MLLVTSSSAKQPLLDAAASACRSARGSWAVLAGDANPLAPTLLVSDHTWLMPRLDSLEDADWLKLIDVRGVKAIVPTRDGDLPWLADRRDLLIAAGVNVMVSPPTAIGACDDKLVFAEQCTAVGIPVIPVFTDVDAVSAHTGTYVVKDRCGAGSRRIALDVGLEDAKLIAAAIERPIYQPFVKGAEFSVDVYVSRSGLFVGGVARSRDVVVGGESQVSTVVDRGDAIDLARRVVDALGVTGHAVIQMIDDGDSLHVVECNPRIGGASTLAFAAGLRSIEWFLAEIEGVDAASFTPPEPQIGLRLVRLPSDVIA